MSVKELKEIYENGFILEFDDNDKIVFISDVHRGDGTYSDSLLPNRNIYITALKYYLEKNYIYIEVGDGDELWKNKNCNEISFFYDDVFKLFNKFNKNSIDINILKIIFSEYNIIGKIDINNKYNLIINKNANKIDKNIKKEYLKIIEKYLINRKKQNFIKKIKNKILEVRRSKNE